MIIIEKWNVSRLEHFFFFFLSLIMFFPTDEHHDRSFIDYFFSRSTSS